MSTFVDFHVHYLQSSLVEGLNVSCDTNLAPGELDFILQVLLIFALALSVVGFDLFLLISQDLLNNFEVSSFVRDRFI